MDTHDPADAKELCRAYRAGGRETQFLYRNPNVGQVVGFDGSKDRQGADRSRYGHQVDDTLAGQVAPKTSQG